MTQVDRTTFKGNTTTLYADNATGNISAGDLRTQMNDIADSVVFRSTGYTAAPTANDDDVGTAGNGIFGVGDIWLDGANNKAYICSDNSTANSVWVEITATPVSIISSTNVPAPTEVAFWTDSDTIRGTPDLLWVQSSKELQVDGDITITGTIDGRNVSVDGSKLDGIPANAIDALNVIDININTGNTVYDVTTLSVLSGSGLLVIDRPGNEVRLELDNNRITVDTSDRTLTDSDNNSYITNIGATGTVRWEIPKTSGLTSAPRLVAVFFKTTDQKMEIIGDNSVIINGVFETGGGETLNTICDKPFSSMAYIIYSGSTNTYYLIETSESLTQFNDGILTSYTLLLSDRGKIVTTNNGSPNTVTIPAEASVNFPVGTEIKVIQKGSGTTTIVGGTGVTLNGIVAGSGDITAQWDEVRLYKSDSDEWIAVGGIGAVS
jgi:hypothetical protein